MTASSTSTFSTLSLHRPSPKHHLNTTTTFTFPFTSKPIIFPSFKTHATEPETIYMDNLDDPDQEIPFNPPEKPDAWSSICFCMLVINVIISMCCLRNREDCLLIWFSILVMFTSGLDGGCGIPGGSTGASPSVTIFGNVIHYLWDVMTEILEPPEVSLRTSPFVVREGVGTILTHE